MAINGFQLVVLVSDLDLLPDSGDMSSDFVSSLLLLFH